MKQQLSLNRFEKSKEYFHVTTSFSCTSNFPPKKDGERDISGLNDPSYSLASKMH